MPRDGQDIAIGRVIGPFGIRGEIKLIGTTDFPERFDAGREITLSLPKGRVTRRIERSQPHRSGFTMKLEGVDTRAAAEELRGIDIMIGEADLRELESDKYYIFDIMGLKVVTDDGREQGTVTEVIQAGANDVYVTSTGLCIPALKDVVAEIDVNRGVMVIRPVPGLLPE